jgi:hypothetical protein
MAIFEGLITFVLDYHRKAGQGQANQNRHNGMQDKVQITFEKKQKVKLISSGPVQPE